MCFSPAASFGGAAVVAGFGAVSLAEVRNAREAVLGALPAAFAVHEAVEGVVWLGVRRDVGPTALHVAAHAYALFAWALLPLWVPLGVFLVEQRRTRRRILGVMVAAGAAMLLWLAWAAIAYPVDAHAVHHSMIYEMQHRPGSTVAGIYLVLTCGSLLCSSWRPVVILGLVNIVGAAVTVAIKASAFTSLWCAYAALVSIVIVYALRAMRTSDHAEGADDLVEGRGQGPERVGGEGLEHHADQR